MKINILTLFPDMFKGPFDESIIKRAQDKGLVEIKIHNLRKWGLGERKTVDDRPYGGGTGMVLMVEPIYNALNEIKTKDSKVILLTPQGKPFDQTKAGQLSKEKEIILICGHYEGYDERIRSMVNQELSIGDYILTGGEIPAMAIVDATIRLMPGVLEKPEAVEFESFTQNLIEYPQYTRPEKFNNMKVPQILLSGNHKEIDKWRKQEAIKKTKKNRPDLLEK